MEIYLSEPPFIHPQNENLGTPLMVSAVDPHYTPLTPAHKEQRCVDCRLHGIKTMSILITITSPRLEQHQAHHRRCSVNMCEVNWSRPQSMKQRKAELSWLKPDVPFYCPLSLESLWELQDYGKPSLNTIGLEVEASPLHVIILWSWWSTCWVEVE